MHAHVAAGAVLVLSCCLSQAATAKQPATGRSADVAESRAPRLRLADVNDTNGMEPGAVPLAARDRQKACAAQWRGFSAAEKSAQGPKWPQFYNRCIKRLKALRD